MGTVEPDLHCLDDVIAAMYASISGPPGGQDWTLSRRLFHPRAQLVRTGVDAAGAPKALVFALDEYQRNATDLLRDVSFHEVEIARRSIRFGNVAQVFSAYEARSAPRGGTLLKRGMNLIHLYDDGTRWWIMQMIWDDERDGVELPDHLFSVEPPA
ncbi:MAG TPA: hypothetical protein VLT59_03315 [Steroidobacteraceae bacterium]|nr:hypothetical protein [Steroidobacteraceae bacterium]